MIARLVRSAYLPLQCRAETSAEVPLRYRSTRPDRRRLGLWLQGPLVARGGRTAAGSGSRTRLVGGVRPANGQTICSYQEERHIPSCIELGKLSLSRVRNGRIKSPPPYYATFQAGHSNSATEWLDQGISTCARIYGENYGSPGMECPKRGATYIYLVVLSRGQEGPRGAKRGATYIYLKYQFSLKPKHHN